MISFVEGKLEVTEPTHVLINANGIGYEIKISLNTFSDVKSKEKARIHTHFHVKEDAQILYGFSQLSERTRFRDLISINGVGPSTALMILSSLSPDELQTAIAHEQINVIQGVKGIGAKTAQRIVLELKDKMKKEGLLEKAIEIAPSVDNTKLDEALSALITLGINKPTADKTVRSLLRQNPDLSLEELIKLALKRA
jgi:Holliday junction DNA helicase RuvA